MGHRVVAIDGSTLTLPQQSDLADYFGAFKSQYKSGSTGARISVAYDVCNHLILDASINKVACSELEMARAHLIHLNPFDNLLLFDRGYPSIDFAMELDKQGFKFCFRLSKSWKEAYDLLQVADDMDWCIKKANDIKSVIKIRAVSGKI